MPGRTQSSSGAGWWQDQTCCLTGNRQSSSVPHHSCGHLCPHKASLQDLPKGWIFWSYRKFPCGKWSLYSYFYFLLWYLKYQICCNDLKVQVTYLFLYFKLKFVLIPLEFKVTKVLLYLANRRFLLLHEYLIPRLNCFASNQDNIYLRWYKIVNAKFWSTFFSLHLSEKLKRDFKICDMCSLWFYVDINSCLLIRNLQQVCCTLPSVHVHCRNQLFPCWHTSCTAWSVDFWWREATPFYPAITKTRLNLYRMSLFFSCNDNIIKTFDEKFKLEYCMKQPNTC